MALNEWWASLKSSLDNINNANNNKKTSPINVFKITPIYYYIIIITILPKVIPGEYFMYLPRHFKNQSRFLSAFHKARPWSWVPLVGLPCMGLYSDKVCRPGGFTLHIMKKQQQQQQKKKRKKKKKTCLHPHTLFQKTIKFLLTKIN